MPDRVNKTCLHTDRLLLPGGGHDQASQVDTIHGWVPNQLSDLSGASIANFFGAQTDARLFR
jgi:hypothetical protein